jgi:hypothetical protein
MGYFYDTTVEIVFKGVKKRVSQGVADSLAKSGKLSEAKDKKAAKK